MALGAAVEATMAPPVVVGRRSTGPLLGFRKEVPLDEGEAGGRPAAAAEAAAVAAGEAKAARAGAAATEQGARLAETEARRARDVTTDQVAAELLLVQDARERAALVSPEQPFGELGKPLNRRSTVRQGFGLTVGALLAIAVGRAVESIEQELLLLLVAAFLAIGLDPVVDWLVRHGLRRGWAVLLILVIALGSVAAFAAAAIPPITQEANLLIQQAPGYFQELQSRHGTLGRLDSQFHIVNRLQHAAAALGGSAVGGLLNAGVAAISFTAEVLLVAVLTIYFLINLPQIKPVFYRLAPLSRRARVGVLTDEILTRVGGYVLGNVFTSLVAVAAFYIELRIFSVPYALALAVLVGVLDLIPLIGSTLAGVVVVLVAWAAVGPTAALVTIGFFLVYRLFEDYLLGPWILRRTVDVSPLVSIVAIILGGALLGIIGALIAVPIAAGIQLLIVEVLYPRQDAA
jgi:predicted PurR-regulated permease PerM